MFGSGKVLGNNFFKCFFNKVYISLEAGFGAQSLYSIVVVCLKYWILFRIGKYSPLAAHFVYFKYLMFPLLTTFCTNTNHAFSLWSFAPLLYFVLYSHCAFFFVAYFLITHFCCRAYFKVFFIGFESLRVLLVARRFLWKHTTAGPVHHQQGKRIHGFSSSFLPSEKLIRFWGAGHEWDEWKVMLGGQLSTNRVNRVDRRRVPPPAE